MACHQLRGGVFLLTACVLAGLVGGCGPVKWEFDRQSGLEKAVQTRQRAVIMFVSGFDQGANQMDDKVFRDPDVVKLMQRFVAIRLDAGLNRKMIEQFGVQKTPAFVVVRPDLTMAGMQEGTMTADQFRMFLIKYSLN